MGAVSKQTAEIMRFRKPVVSRPKTSHREKVGGINGN